MAHSPSDTVVAKQDPWRWVTFSAFWGSLYYLFVGVGLLAGKRSATVRINRQPALVGFLVYITSFVAGGVSFSFLQQLIVRRSATAQSREVIATGELEPSIPLQALGGAAGAVVPIGLVVGANMLAKRLTKTPVFEPESVAWPQTVLVTATVSGLASLAVSRIAAWIADDAQHPNG